MNQNYGLFSFVEVFSIIHNNKKIKENLPKILHYSSYNIKCGIATFLNDFIKGLEDNDFTNNDIVAINKNVRKSVPSYIKYLDLLIENAKDYDYIILQHEYDLYNCNCDFYDDEYEQVIKQLNLDKNLNYRSLLINSAIFTDYIITNLLKQNKKVFVVWHTTFKKVIDHFIKNNIELNFERLPVFRHFNNENLKIFVMTTDMIDILKKYKISTRNVSFMAHPIPTRQFNISKDLVNSIKQNYQIKNDDVVLGQFGFIGGSKGNMNILKAMKYLPQNFKYIMIGGKHPTDDSDYYDNLVKYIKDNNLEKRVFITDFIKEEEVVNYLSIVDLATYIYNLDGNFASGSVNQILMYNIPVIASNSMSFNDLKNNYDCVEITNNGNDPEKLAEDIQNLLKNNNRIDTLKENMQKFCKENTFRNFTNKVLGVLNE